MEKININIGILGAGNIGLAIADGIRKSKITRNKISISRGKTGSFSREEQKTFLCNNENLTIVQNSKIIVLAVQPKQLDDLIVEIKDVLTPEHLVISVVSGVNIKRIESLIGKEIPIARAMPNTAIRVGQSMTCLAFNESGMKHKTLVEKIFNSVGITLLIPESKFAEATVLCGSGPALVLKFIRAYMQACIQNGFDKEPALLIAGQITKGAAMIVQENNNHPESEIDKVTTPSGCTIIALAEMEHTGFISSILKAIEAGVEKSKMLYL